MGGMFYEAESFSQPLEKWNASKVEQYKNKNKANSNISTQQTQLTKQPATNMIRCDDRKILEHIIQSDKNNTMNLYNNRAEIETVAPVPPSNPIKVSAAIGYNVRLMDNGEIILDARMINK